MICVVDSGVWISAFQFGGTPMVALDLAYQQDLIAICKPIIDEIHAVLGRKFAWLPAEVEGVLEEYLTGTILTEITGNVRGVCRDPKDDMVFECAKRAGASIIVSGDKDILTVAYEGIRTLRPRDYLSMQLKGRN